MMFNFKNYFRSITSPKLAAPDSEYIFSWPLFILRIFLFIAFHILLIINHTFMLLDEVFFFNYRNTKIDRPLMIIGVPRTGTTTLFRTLASDKDNFTYFTFGEILFAPSLIQKFFWYAIGQLDRLLGKPFKKLLLFIEHKMKSPYSRIHDFGLFKPEEDEFMLLYIFSSIVLKYFFPASKEFDKYAFFDEKVSEREKKSIFHFQQRCIKKHVYFHKIISGTTRTFLSKNPIYSPKIDSLFRFYPGLRVIFLTRSMKEVVPSFLSMNAAGIKGLHATKTPYPNAAEAREVILNWQNQLEEKLMRHPQTDIYHCRYAEITTDLKKTVLSIYQHFGIEIKEHFIHTLDKCNEDQISYTPTHKYDIAEIENILLKESGAN